MQTHIDFVRDLTTYLKETAATEDTSTYPLLKN